MAANLTFEEVRVKHAKQAALDAARAKRVIPPFVGTPIPGPCRIYTTGHRGYKHPRKRLRHVMVCSGCGQAMDWETVYCMVKR